MTSSAVHCCLIDLESMNTPKIMINLQLKIMICFDSGRYEFILYFWKNIHIFSIGNFVIMFHYMHNKTEMTMCFLNYDKVAVKASIAGLNMIFLRKDINGVAISA